MRHQGSASSGAEDRSDAASGADRQPGDAAGHYVTRASAAVVLVRTQSGAAPAVSATGRPEREQAPKCASTEGAQ